MTQEFDTLIHIMDSPLQFLLDQIKAARENKGLSQRALGERVGLPQSHISKIENGGVDLQASNLLEIARALDLELTLVPRAALPAIRAIQEAQRPTRLRNSARETVPTPAQQRPAYTLDNQEDSDG